MIGESSNDCQSPMEKAPMIGESSNDMEKAPMIAKVAELPGWARLWDHALDLRWKAVLGLKMVGRTMSHHRKGGHPCYMCDVTLYTIKNCT